MQYCSMRRFVGTYANVSLISLSLENVEHEGYLSCHLDVSFLAFDIFNIQKRKATEEKTRRKSQTKNTLHAR